MDLIVDVVQFSKGGNIGNVGKVLVDALGGEKTGRILFGGKVSTLRGGSFPFPSFPPIRTQPQRAHDVNAFAWLWPRVYKGHTIGEVHIAALAVDDEDVEDEAEGQVQRFEGTMVIPFKNENLYAEVDKGDGSGPKVCGLSFFFAYFFIATRATSSTTASPHRSLYSPLHFDTTLTVVPIPCRS